MGNFPDVLLITIEDQLADIFFSKKDIIELTQTFAERRNKTVPITDPNIATKKEILHKNIGSLSDDEKYDFMSQLQKASFIQSRSPLYDEIDELLSYKNCESNNDRARSSVIQSLSNYSPKIKQQWLKACAFYDGKDYRNALDNIRLTIELLVKSLTNNNASLENQKRSLGEFLKSKGVSKQIRNFLFKILDSYEKIQNNNAKHDVPEHLNKEEVTFVMNLSYSIIKFLLECEDRSL